MNAGQRGLFHNVIQDVVVATSSIAIHVEELSFANCLEMLKGIKHTPDQTEGWTFEEARATLLTVLKRCVAKLEETS